jgi:geranylgeranyl reductase family protein
MNSLPIAIVGAGPAGLKTAIHLSKKGIDCTILEEHGQIGLPENCSGLISNRGSKKAELPLDECTVNKIRGARIFSPNNTVLSIERSEPVATLVKRSKLDEELGKEAKKSGAGIRMNTRLIDIRKNTLFVEANGRGELLKASIVVGSDGPNSKTRNLMGIKANMEDFIHSYQVRAKGSFDPEMVELYFGGFAWNFFAWVIPENKTTARIGLGCKTGLNPKKQFEGFVQQKKIEFETLEESSFLIPCRKPMEKLVQENKLLAGDAGFFTKSTTGGGIVFSALAGQKAAETIHEHLVDNKPLDNYHQKTLELRKELELHWKLHKYFTTLTDSDINHLFSKLKKANIEQLLAQEGNMDFPTQFVPKLLWNPRMLAFLPDAVKFLRA